MNFTPTSRVARGLLRLYPARWRSRYADEVLDLLRARPLTAGDTVNLALHALYAHLHPDITLTGDESLAERLVVLMHTLRSSEIATFWAFVAAMIAWLQFGGLVDGGPYMALTSSAGSWPGFGVHPANGISAALAVQSAAADVALLATLCGGLPLALAAWRRAPALRRYFLVPLAAVVGAVLPLPIAVLLRGHVATINLTLTTPITVAYLVWFAALATASAVALSRIIAGGARNDRLLRFAFVPSGIVTLALVLLLGSTLAWGIAAHLEYPHLFDQVAITRGYATVVTWTIDVAVMLCATVIAVLATVRGMRFTATAPGGAR